MKHFTPEKLLQKIYCIQYTVLGDSYTEPSDLFTVQISAGSPLLSPCCESSPLLLSGIPCCKRLFPLPLIWTFQINRSQRRLRRANTVMVCFAWNTFTLAKKGWSNVLVKRYQNLQVEYFMENLNNSFFLDYRPLSKSLDIQTTIFAKELTNFFPICSSCTLV